MAKQKPNPQKSLFYSDEPVRGVLGHKDLVCIDNLKGSTDEDSAEEIVAYPPPRLYVAIDNGITGTIAFMKDDGRAKFFHKPIKVQQSYTKAKQNISRVDAQALFELLRSQIDSYNVHVIMERPMVNPTRFKASISAMRCHEAELVVIEMLQLPYSYMDSRKWQKELLPSGLETDQLKKASLEIGNRLFPQFRDNKHKDRDSLLMAEYARRNRL